jgi:ABC-type multidrug transport system ATPase subunit
MTLLLGPPSSGRSLLMKLLSHRLTPSSTASSVEGQIVFNGDSIYGGRFFPGKVVDYVDQKENHAALLTVEETLRYAYKCTTEYGNDGVDKEEVEVAVHNMLTILGLQNCKDTLVGDESTRGISGGEKRRLTLGEMLITDRPVKMLDSITDGLDAATAYDIMRYLRDACSVLGHTYLIALHQVPSVIYELFDDVMIFSEGRVIYQGDRTLAKTYFESLGFQCPVDVDEVEFLQEMATAEGGTRFFRGMSLTKLHAFCDNNKVETAHVQEMDGDVDLVADFDLCFVLCAIRM